MQKGMKFQYEILDTWVATLWARVALMYFLMICLLLQIVPLWIFISLVTLFLLSWFDAFGPNCPAWILDLEEFILEMVVILMFILATATINRVRPKLDKFSPFKELRKLERLNLYLSLGREKRFKNAIHGMEKAVTELERLSALEDGLENE